jgi:hypothetical protein
MTAFSRIMVTVGNLGMTLGAYLGSLVVYLQLEPGPRYYGTIIHASPELLSASIANGFLLACALSILGAGISLVKSQYRSKSHLIFKITVTKSVD